MAEIKRRSLIEDKKAMHEEEIIMQAPTDNIIKSATIPEPIIKLKSSVNDEIDVSKSDFDKELQNKLKTTLKDVDSFEHQSQPSIDEKIQLDTAITEKPFKKDEDHSVVSSSRTEVVFEPIAATNDILKEFLDHESRELIPITVHQSSVPETQQNFSVTETMTSTKDFLNSEMAAQHETDTVVTNYKVEEHEGPDHLKTVTSTKTTTVTREWTEPMETVTKVSGPTVQISREILHGDASDSDEFYKTIQEKITKKMSQDLSIHQDDNIADGKPFRTLIQRGSQSNFAIYHFQYQTKFWSHKLHHRHQMIQININPKRSGHTFTVSKNLHFFFINQFVFNSFDSKIHLLLVFGCVFSFPFNEKEKNQIFCMTLCVSFNISFIFYIYDSLYTAIAVRC